MKIQHAVIVRHGLGAQLRSDPSIVMGLDLTFAGATMEYPLSGQSGQDHVRRVDLGQSYRRDMRK